MAKECPQIKPVTVTSTNWITTNTIMSLQSGGRLFAPGCLPALMKRYRRPPRTCKAQQASSVMKCVIAFQDLKSRLGRSPSRSSNLTAVVRFAHKTFISVYIRVIIKEINNREMIWSTLNQILQSNPPLLPNTSLAQNHISFKAVAQRCSPRRRRQLRRRRPCSQICTASCKNSCRSKTSQV